MRFVHNEFMPPYEKGEHGDCQRAVVCSILDIPRKECPHFGHDDPAADEFHRRLDAFLKTKGRRRFIASWEWDLIALRKAMASFNKPWVLVGDSRNGTGHCVVCVRGAIVHDPSGGGIVSPQRSGGWKYYVETYPLDEEWAAEKAWIETLLLKANARCYAMRERWKMEAVEWRRVNGGPHVVPLPGNPKT